MGKNSTACEEISTAVPRVVVVGLASCFGCQLQITNKEAYLLDVLGQIDLRYWQLTSSAPMPESCDVAVIEGAVTTEEAAETVKALRAKANVIVCVGACATTAGIPGMASESFEKRPAEVYGEGFVPQACATMIAPRPVSDVIKVDFEVRCCPIDFFDFVNVLHKALYGSNRALQPTSTMCGDCKRNENTCFYDKHTLCLGLVTRAGCGARCVNLGRPCNGCRGLSPEANLAAAREACLARGVSVEHFDRALEMFNQVNPIRTRGE